MSQQTFICFFTIGHLDDPAKVLEDTLNIIDPHYIDVTIYGGIDQSWLYRDEDYDGPPIELLSLRMSKQDAVEHLMPYKLLAIDCSCSMLDLVRGEIEREVPPGIYGNTLPQNTEVKVGPHDIFDQNRVSGGLFGHATFSVCFWGYRHPPDIEAYRRVITKLPIIQSIQVRLAASWGPTQNCVYNI